ncbi:general amidase [Fusarium mundagurra]|uniref:amidase n=1 Tax=Fusarium mundagurra TaxID=1567541 RepID=A0A8H5YVL8_9HYPO|nr:general amidase [Fusarium mundagurra]
MYRISNRDGASNNPSRSLRDLPPLSIPKKRKPKMSKRPSRLLACPIEIQLHVLEFVPKEGLVALSRVNKHLASIAQPVLHREVDVNCPRVSFQCYAAPLVLVLRTLLSRPDLAQAVQHLRFDGYDFVERRLNELPTTPIFHLTDEDKLKAVKFIKALDLYQGLDWAQGFLKGRVDCLVSLMVALTPKICYLRMLLSPESFGNPGGSNVHKFEHLHRVTVDNHCAPYYHTRFDFRNVYQDFFRLLMLESLSISGSFPEESQTFNIMTKLEHLRRLDLKRISAAELGRILSIAPNLKELKYNYAWYPITNMRPAPDQTLDLNTLRDSLESHRLELEKLELLVLDDGDVLDERPEDTINPLILRGSSLKLHDFSNLHTLTAPWILVAGPSKGEHPSPLRHLIPKSVEWEPEEIYDMLTEYWYDLRDTKTALAAMFLVGPLISKMLDEDEFRIARRLARSAGVNFCVDELSIDKCDALREAEERALRYGQPRESLSKMNGNSWEARAAAKRAATLDKIPSEWRLSSEDLERAQSQRDITGSFIEKFLGKETVSITSLKSVEILNALSEKELTATKVVRAFCQRAAVAHQINNCLHEIFFDQAFERARYLDDYFTKHGKTLGPLHGLPVSLKDQFHVKGVDTTMGYVGWIDGNLGIDPDKSHTVESQIVTELLSLGAVLYCKTSLPQTLLFGETKNKIISQTLNPINQNLSCGGSSGGEAALMALGGSSVGVGTDIGGSLRIPAGFCGIFSIKPTSNRLSYRDVANTNPGQDTYRSTIGFMGTSIDALEVVFKAVLGREPWIKDPAVIPIPFRKEVMESYRRRADEKGNARFSERPLKMGVLWCDGMVGLHPPVLHGLRVVVEALKKAGHKGGFLSADGAHDIHQHLKRSGEPLIPDLKAGLNLRTPTELLKYQDLTIQGLEYERQYSDYWNSTAESDGQVVDAVLMPVAPHAAVIPGKFYHGAYTDAMNLTNYTAVVIPTIRADKRVDVFDEGYEPLGEMDRKNWQAYDADLYDGGPVGVQIVGRKFEEEKCLAIARVVHAAVQSATKAA